MHWQTIMVYTREHNWAKSSRLFKFVFKVIQGHSQGFIQGRIPGVHRERSHVHLVLALKGVISRWHIQQGQRAKGTADCEQGQGRLFPFKRLAVEYFNTTAQLQSLERQKRQSMVTNLTYGRKDEEEEGRRKKKESQKVKLNYLSLLCGDFNSRHL